MLDSSEPRAATKTDSSERLLEGTWDRALVLEPGKKAGTEKKPPVAAKKPEEFSYSFARGDWGQIENPKIVHGVSTVAVLDDYTTPDGGNFNGHRGGPPHGEVSATAAEQHGFNVLRLQYGNKPMSEQLADINRDIESGKLPPLGTGDVLNMSFGNQRAFSSITYKDASDMLGVNITPENIADKKVQDQIISGLGSLEKTSRDPKIRAKAKETLAEIREIDKLQAKGIEVMAAAGNAGPNVVDLDYIHVKAQMAGLGLDGKPASWSARNSSTKDGKAVYEVQYTPWIPTFTLPVSYQRGMGEYTLKGPDTHFYDLRDDCKIRDVTEIRPDGQIVYAPTKKSDPAPKMVKSVDVKAPRLLYDSYNYFDPQAVVGNYTTVKTKVADTAAVLYGRTNGDAYGSSFANIDELEKERERLNKEKNGG